MKDDRCEGNTHYGCACDECPSCARLQAAAQVKLLGHNYKYRDGDLVVEFERDGVRCAVCVPEHEAKELALLLKQDRMGAWVRIEELWQASLKEPGGELKDECVLHAVPEDEFEVQLLAGSGPPWKAQLGLAAGQVPVTMRHFIEAWDVQRSDFIEGNLVSAKDVPILRVFVHPVATLVCEGEAAEALKRWKERAEGMYHAATAAAVKDNARVTKTDDVAKVLGGEFERVALHFRNGWFGWPNKWLKVTPSWQAGFDARREYEGGSKKQTVVKACSHTSNAGSPCVRKAFHHGPCEWESDSETEITVQVGDWMMHRVGEHEKLVRVVRMNEAGMVFFDDHTHANVAEAAKWKVSAEQARQLKQPVKPFTETELNAMETLVSTERRRFRATVEYFRGMASEQNDKLGLEVSAHKKAQKEMSRLDEENEDLRAELETAHEKLAATSGSCANCKAPLGVMGCDSCDIELCACCVASHDHVSDEDDPPCKECGHPRSQHNAYGHDSGPCTACPDRDCMDYVHDHSRPVPEDEPVEVPKRPVVAPEKRAMNLSLGCTCRYEQLSGLLEEYTRYVTQKCPLHAKETALPDKDPPCVIGEHCARHGYVHGAEAEELRARFEELAEDEDCDEYTLSLTIARILDQVDARDSLAYRAALEQDRGPGGTPNLWSDVRDGSPTDVGWDGTDRGCPRCASEPGAQCSFQDVDGHGVEVAGWVHRERIERSEAEPCPQCELVEEARVAGIEQARLNAERSAELEAEAVAALEPKEVSKRKLGLAPVVGEKTRVQNLENGCTCRYWPMTTGRGVMEEYVRHARSSCPLHAEESSILDTKLSPPLPGPDMADDAAKKLVAQGLRQLPSERLVFIAGILMRKGANNDYSWSKTGELCWHRLEPPENQVTVVTIPGAYVKGGAS